MLAIFAIMFDLATTRVPRNERDRHDEARQGEAYAPFKNDPVEYKRRLNMPMKKEG